MNEIAAGHGIALYSCCNDDLVGGLVKKASCVDREFLAGLFGLNPGLYRQNPTRSHAGAVKAQ